MSQYYFTVANLPTLMFNRSPALGIAEFLELCQTSLKPADYRLLQQVDYRLPAGSQAAKPVLAKWQAWETTLRNTLVGLRGSSKPFAAEKYLRPGAEELGAITAAQAASEEADPLRAEELLDRARWQLLEDLEVGHYFDLSKLILYFLKLQLLTRRFAFDQVRGEQVYKDLQQTFQAITNSRENGNDK